MFGTAALFDVCDRRDQERVVADLRTFFGSRADVYLAHYEKIRQRPSRKRAATWSWSWPVFLLSFVWFFYRKQHLVGAGMLVVPIVIGVLYGTLSTGAYIGFAIFGKTWYVQSALRRLVKADGLGLTEEERDDYLRRAGGVSKLAGGIALLIFVALIALTVIGAIAERSGAAR